MRRVLLLTFLFFMVLGCASTTKTPIHKIVDSDIVRTKIVLLDRDNVEFAYQKAAVREFEAQLLKKPVTFAIRSTLSGKEIDFVLITRKEVQRIPSATPEEIVRIGQESDVNTLIVLEPLKVQYSEGSSKKGEEFCVVRRANVLIAAKVFETKTGNLIFGGVYEGKAKARQCSRGIRRTDELPSRDALILKTIKRAAIKFAGEFWSSL
ncbi:hypothetical protein [Hydrogenivirga sp.]